jgi:hypothetical protein
MFLYQHVLYATSQSGETDNKAATIQETQLRAHNLQAASTAAHVLFGQAAASTSSSARWLAPGALLPAATVWEDTEFQ